MRFKSQKLAGFIIILLALAMILPVSAFEDTQTRHIEQQDPGLDADWFVTEAGIGYSTSLVTITDPNMDIYAYLFFEDIKINYWQHLENATLWLRTASSMPFDAESKVTIYGVDDYRYFGSGTKGYGPLASPGSIMGAPLTIAHVDYNTSQFYGPQWWNISVTNIVQELKSNYHWDGPGFVRSDPGDNMAFIFLSAGGYDTRYFYDLKAGNGLEAKLELHWGGSSHPPSGYPNALFNQSYGNYTIWSNTYDPGENRTGAPPSATSVNWNLLNQTELSEHDSGASVTVNSATWTTFTNLIAQSTTSLYNDTGDTLITQYFVRLAVNVSDIDNTVASERPLGALAGISTIIPTGTNGLPYGASGDWVGLLVTCHQDDDRYRYGLRERHDATDENANWSDWYTENTAIHYIEFQMNDTGASNWISYKVFSDPEFTIMLEDELKVLGWASGPFRYPQILSSAGSIAGNDRWTGEYYTYLDMPLDVGTTWIVAYANGTVLQDELDSLEDAQDWIDIFDTDPEDPDPGGEWGTTGPFTRFKMRLYFLILGFGCVFGPVLFFSWRRPTAYYLMVGAMIMIMGLGLLMAIGDI